MAQHIDLGKRGEQLAEEYLVKYGYAVMHRNWRHSHYEIDIIAQKNNVVHFVEVKIRSSKTFGFPEENVTRKKFKFLTQAADEFLFLNQHYKHIQFDILSINVVNTEVEYFFIEDVYF